jgi:hypothetical protein
MYKYMHSKCLSKYLFTSCNVCNVILKCLNCMYKYMHSKCLSLYKLQFFQCESQVYEMLSLKCLACRILFLIRLLHRGLWNVARCPCVLDKSCIRDSSRGMLEMFFPWFEVMLLLGFCIHL